jgi:hypothetical protein
MVVFLEAHDRISFSRSTCVRLSRTGFILRMRIFCVRFLCGGLVASWWFVQGACLCGINNKI